MYVYRAGVTPLNECGASRTNLPVNLSNQLYDPELAPSTTYNVGPRGRRAVAYQRLCDSMYVDVVVNGR